MRKITDEEMDAKIDIQEIIGGLFEQEEFDEELEQIKRSFHGNYIPKEGWDE